MISQLSRNSPRGGAAGTALGDEGTEEYWSKHNVTLHYAFQSADESRDYFAWRNDQYFGYIDLMPVDCADGLAVLDYGCGPGHDLVGFGLYSKPKRLIGMDISEPSLDEATFRVSLHSIEAEIFRLEPSQTALPLEDASIDLVHSSGVLHHTPRPDLILRELYRILRPAGRAQIMVYNDDSLWMHLYVAYQKMILEGAFKGMDLRDAFEKTTDGPDCPIARAYKPGAFIELARSCGFTARFKGAAISAFEMSLLPKRHEAIMDRQLLPESRKFLCGLRFSDRGLPLNHGEVAGVDGCYELVRA